MIGLRSLPSPKVGVSSSRLALIIPRAAKTMVSKIIAKIIKTIGRCHSHWGPSWARMLIWNAFSMILPSISASTRGGRGQPPRFMIKPTKPIANTLIQSPRDAPPSHAPMKINKITPGTIKWPGKNATLATCLLQNINNTATTTLAMTIVHTMENVI